MGADTTGSSRTGAFMETLADELDEELEENSRQLLNDAYRRLAEILDAH